MNIVAKFVEFVKAQPADTVIYHTEWNKCAVGQFAKTLEGDISDLYEARDYLLAELNEKHNEFYEMLNNGGAISAKKFPESYIVYWYWSDKASEYPRLLLRQDGKWVQNPQIKIATFGELAKTINTVFPELNHV